MNKIRICHFSTVHIRADVRIFHKECTSLAEAGYEVHLAVADGKGNAVVKGIRIHDIGKISNRIARIIFSPIMIFFKVLSLRCVVYHFHDPELLFVGLFLKLLTKAKVIYDAHECYSEYFLHKEYLPEAVRPLFSAVIKAVERCTAGRFDQVITTTEYQAAKLKGINPRLDIIYNYPLLSEWNFSNQLPEAGKQRAICYIGSISEERGISQVIKAIENIDCVFHLAGSYAIPSYRNEIMKLSGWSKVVEHGYVNREQAAGIISKSLIGIVLLLPKPNHLISHSTKIFEYMAGGIACLVPDFPIWKDIVEKHECGLCVDPNDIALIAKTLEQMLDNPDLMREMGQIGKQLVQSTYNWESQIPALLNIYRTALMN